MYVITDNPDYYDRFDRITVVPITTETLKDWQGDRHFFWQVKIKAMEYMAATYKNQDLLYLDSDTILKNGLRKIQEMLASGKCLMHTNEGHPSRMKTKSYRMWKQVRGRCYSGITIGQEHDMWNAGVVGIPQKKQKVR